MKDYAQGIVSAPSPRPLLQKEEREKGADRQFHYATRARIFLWALQKGSFANCRSVNH